MVRKGASFPRVRWWALDLSSSLVAPDPGGMDNSSKRSYSPVLRVKSKLLSTAHRFPLGRSLLASLASSPPNFAFTHTYPATPASLLLPKHTMLVPTFRAFAIALPALNALLLDTEDILLSLPSSVASNTTSSETPPLPHLLK